ncbi:hypothetical protein BC342_25395 [Streptomyces olivaceus]|nr:hypothetical protein BC342_25395 [Streptomyces olivaceus]
MGDARGHGPPGGADAGGGEQQADDVPQRQWLALRDEVGPAADGAPPVEVVEGEQVGVGGGADVGGVDEVGPSPGITRRPRRTARVRAGRKCGSPGPQMMCGRRARVARAGPWASRTRVSATALECG